MVRTMRDMMSVVELRGEVTGRRQDNRRPSRRIL